jgi:hypothetical protein
MKKGVVSLAMPSSAYPAGAQQSFKLPITPESAFGAWASVIPLHLDF